MQIPAMPDEMIRAIALQCACQLTECRKGGHQHTMAVAQSFQEFIDNGGGVIRVEFAGE